MEIGELKIINGVVFPIVVEHNNKNISILNILIPFIYIYIIRLFEKFINKIIRINDENK